VTAGQAWHQLLICYHRDARETSERPAASEPARRQHCGHYRLARRSRRRARTLKPSAIAPAIQAASTATQRKSSRLGGSSPVFGKRAIGGVGAGAAGTGVSVATGTGVSGAAGSGVSVATGTGVSIATGVGVFFRVGLRVFVGTGIGVSVATGSGVFVAVGTGVFATAQDGPVIALLSNVTAPVCTKARPFKLAPVCTLMDVDASILPINEVFVVNYSRELGHAHFW
jgi:hypothetical protein